MSAISVSPIWWLGFAAVVLTSLALDLGVFNRKAHAPSFKEAAGWSAVWVTLAMGFAAVVGVQQGSERAIAFVTGYLIEYALSVDNIFVFLVIFGSFKIPLTLQHRVLFWGIIGAVGLRAAMVFGGVALIERFHWLIYVFGGFLVLTGIKLLVKKDEEEQGGSESGLIRFFRKVVPSTDTLDGDRFFTRVDGRLLATPLFLVLMLVETTDVIFALDSIPAIFSVTTDPFLVLTSNIFAILGLRSMFFLLSGVADRFPYLKYGLAAVLIFVGSKMALIDFFHVPVWLSLLIVATLLGSSVLFSLWKTGKDRAAAADATRVS